MKVIVSVWLGLFCLTAIANEVKNVEIQWAVCDTDEATVLEKMGAKDAKLLSRDTYFSDTPNLELMDIDVRLRTRVNGNKIKTVAKVNYALESHIPWIHFDGALDKCEEDYHFDRSKFGCSQGFETEDLDQPYSESQIDLIQNQRGFTKWDEVQTYGPAESNEWTWKKGGITFALESLTYKDKYFGMELSVRTKRANRNEVYEKVQQLLVSNDVNLCILDEGRTRALLESMIE